MSERLAQLMKLYEMDPDDAFVTYGIAMAHANEGEHEAALDWLGKTIAADADYLYAYFQQAKALAELGNMAGAKAALAEGMKRAVAKGDQHAASEMNDLLESFDAD